MPPVNAPVTADAAMQVPTAPSFQGQNGNAVSGDFGVNITPANNSAPLNVTAAVVDTLNEIVAVQKREQEKLDAYFARKTIDYGVSAAGAITIHEDGPAEKALQRVRDITEQWREDTYELDARPLWARELVSQIEKALENESHG